MSNLFEKFAALKRQIAGNREKMGYDFSFGMTREEQSHITPPPRYIVRILSELHRQLRTNPYFHLHLLRDNHLLRDREFILYEGVGLLITDMHAHYDLAHGHSEIMISHPEFLRLFQEYCARVLLRSCVLEDGETDALFQQMIRHCAALPQ